jgi:Mn-dependent DtxR family transcriptional regulator
VGLWLGELVTIRAMELHLTHEFLLHMLGVQRSTVTVAAGDMQRQELIGYSRGKIQLPDRPRLARAACECYGIVASAYDRLLKDGNSNGNNNTLRYVF